MPASKGSMDTTTTRRPHRVDTALGASARSASPQHAADLTRPVRVAIAHDWLVRYAGSERCVEEMRRAFPQSILLTSVIDRSAVPPLLQDARPSFLQHVPF